MSEQSHTTQFFSEGDTFKSDSETFECTFVSYQERPKQGGAEGEVERYNFTYSFRPHQDMEREREETQVPESVDGKTAEELEAERQAPENQPVPNEGQGAY